MSGIVHHEVSGHAACGAADKYRRQVRTKDRSGVTCQRCLSAIALEYAVERDMEKIRMGRVPVGWECPSCGGSGKLSGTSNGVPVSLPGAGRCLACEGTGVRAK
jgi:hypothetical protein